MFSRILVRVFSAYFWVQREVFVAREVAWSKYTDDAPDGFCQFGDPVDDHEPDGMRVTLDDEDDES